MSMMGITALLRVLLIHFNRPPLPFTFSFDWRARCVQVCHTPQSAFDSVAGMRMRTCDAMPVHPT